jgi:methylated-DNA-protein-cysteine methyltransferase-like protein
VIAAIPVGAVVSYGEVAVRAGRPGAARAVGNVLAEHGGLPWWRVVHSDGRLIAGQAERLQAEGVLVSGGRISGAGLRARLAPDPLGTPPDERAGHGGAGP